MNKDQVKALFVDDMQARKKAIRDFIMDKSQPYEDRLEIWKRTPRHLRHHEDFVVRLKDYEAKYGEILWYKAVGAERHSVIYLTDVTDYDLLYYADEAQRRVFFENCMDLGVHSCTYDW